MEPDTILFIVFVLFMSLLPLGAYWAMRSDMLTPEGFQFCREKGFDSTSFGGSYSEMFGKVKCVSCYDRKCKYKEFNVTRKFGIVKEIKNG